MASEGDNPPSKPAHSNRKLGRPSKANHTGLDQGMPDRILVHAKGLFRQKGYAAVSINDIVAAAGITKPTLYYYFEDKEHLYAAVLCRILERGQDFIESGLKGRTTLTDRLTHLTRGFFNHAPTHLSVLMKDALEHLGEPCRQQVFDALQAHILLPFQRLFEEAYAVGEISNSNALDLAQIYVNMMDSMNLGLEIRFGSKRDNVHYADLLVDLYLHGIQERLDTAE